MKALIFKDKEDVRLKKKLWILGFNDQIEDITEVNSLTKEDILEEYKKDSNIVIIKTEYIAAYLSQKLINLCEALNIIISENEFNEMYSLESIMKLPIVEALKIIDVIEDKIIHIDDLEALVAVQEKDLSKYISIERQREEATKFMDDVLKFF